MRRYIGLAAVSVLFAGLPNSAQTLTNQALSGKYYFRHVSLGTDASSSITDPRSLIGAMTFDGQGGYTFSAQRLVGSTSSTASGSGAYAVDPAGIVTMDNPLRAGVRLNARVGPEALVGSSTETADNVFDMLVAIPAPASAPVMAGISFWTASLEFPGVGKLVRSSFYGLSFSTIGKLDNFAPVGHASNISGGQVVQQLVTGSTYTINADGSGSLIFGPTNGPSLVSGLRTFYVSKSGNIILGGSSGMHDLLLGVKAPVLASSTSFNGNFWAAGLRFNPSSQVSDVSGYTGSMAARGQGTMTWSRRIHQLGAGSYDFTGLNAYSLLSKGSGVTELAQIALGLGGTTVVSSDIGLVDPSAYEIYFGVQMASLTGPGVFLNPQGVTSAASFFPPGTPISPGEFVALFGTGMAASDQTASPPYPPSLNGVTVLVNDKPAPLQFVSANRINCLIPYEIQGTTATIVVQNAQGSSNTVVVPVVQTMPSIFSLDQTGTGLGAVLHLDGTPVTTNRPAAGNEAVSIYLTGMGAVDPAVADGTAGGSNPLSQTIATPTVLVGGTKATLLYSGLAPGFPGLYQINVQLPPFPPSTGALPLAIQTVNAFHDMVDIVLR
jgi:uncharacterized protein (TIGR03437 family)